MFKEFFCLVQKCMELSFNSIVSLIERIEKVELGAWRKH